MKPISTHLLLPVCSLILFSAHAQVAKPLFDSTHYGFNTGSYPQGQSPSVVRAADLDNDGDSDLVVAQQNFSNGFVVLKNLKKGFYASPVKYNSPAAAKDIVVADFNNDGLKDVALTNTGQGFTGNSIAVFMNRGKGRFTTPVNITVGKGPTGITAADFDQDGDIDLAITNYRAPAGTVSILINKGDGTFNAATSFAAGAAPFKIVAARINNDALPDLVIANENQKVNILFNSGNNNFSTRKELSVSLNTSSGNTLENVQVADMDNDADNDILYSSAYTGDATGGIVAWFKNNGNGNFGAYTPIPLKNDSGGGLISVGDFNNDGRPDVVAASYGPAGFNVVLNNGNDSFQSLKKHTAGEGIESITTADVDNNHTADIVTSDFYSLQVTVHRNFGNAIFPTPALFETNSIVPGALDAADIDGDGDLDVATSGSGIAATGIRVMVQKNNGDGTFASSVDYSVRTGGVQVKLRDLNGDGKPDLLYATAINAAPYDFHTALNKGDGTFGPVQTWSMNSCGWSDIDAFDLDNDGDLDVVVAEWLGCFGSTDGGKRLYISKNNGHGVFAAPFLKTVDPGPSCLAGGDFNKDGKIDIVTGHALSIDVHLGTGTGDLLAPVRIALNKSPYDVIVRDLNGDGNLDIATCTEYNSEGMSVIIGNGDGTFLPAQNYNGAYSPDLRNESGITSGDVDGDGDIDLVVGNYASNDVSIYLNNGNGSFTFPMRYGLYYNTAAPFFGDFNGDGKGDIIATVGLPPSKISGALALLKGTFLQGAAVADNASSANGTVLTKENGAVTDLATVSNPFGSSIDIRFNKIIAGKTIVTLTDLAGRKLKEAVYSDAGVSLRLNVGDQLPKGVYILSIKTNEKQSQQVKLVHE